MSAVVAWVTDHVLRVWEGAENVSVVVLYECPYCQKKHKVSWHSPTGDGGERTAPCTFSTEYLLGRKVRLRWADIPGAVSSALIEFRPDILNSSTDMKEV